MLAGKENGTRSGPAQALCHAVLGNRVIWYLECPCLEGEVTGTDSDSGGPASGGGWDKVRTIGKGLPGQNTESAHGWVSNWRPTVASPGWKRALNSLKPSLIPVYYGQEKKGNDSFSCKKIK